MPRRLRHGLLTAPIAVIAVLAVSSLASAATTCVFAPVVGTPTLTVVHSDGISDVTIRRVPDATIPPRRPSRWSRARPS